MHMVLRRLSNRSIWSVDGTLTDTLGVMAMKGYLILLRSPELETHHQLQFSVISRTPLFSEGAVNTVRANQQKISDFRSGHFESIWSLKLRRDEPVLYSDEWLLKNSKYWKQPMCQTKQSLVYDKKVCLANFLVQGSNKVKKKKERKCEKLQWCFILRQKSGLLSCSLKDERSCVCFVS